MAGKQDEERMKDLLQQGKREGMRAGWGENPTTMVVVDETQKKEWVVPEGPCGFARVNIKPGTCLAARIAKKFFDAGKSYYGGVDIWISAHGQSYERKLANAQAFAKVLQAAGIQAVADGRLD